MTRNGDLEDGKASFFFAFGNVLQVGKGSLAGHYHTSQGLSCLLDLGPPPRTRHIQHHTKDPIPLGSFSFDCYQEKSEFSLHHIQPTKMQGGLRVHLFNLYLLGNLGLLQTLGIQLRRKSSSLEDLLVGVPEQHLQSSGTIQQNSPLHPGALRPREQPGLPSAAQSGSPAL